MYYRNMQKVHVFKIRDGMKLTVMDKRKVIAIKIERRNVSSHSPDPSMSNPAYQALAAGDLKTFTDWFKKAINDAREAASKYIKPKTKEVVPHAAPSQESPVPSPEDLLQKIIELDNLFQVLHKYMVDNNMIPEATEA